MTEQEIFERLFQLASASKDPRGVVAAALVRQGEIVAESASSDDGRYHAEYLVLKQIQQRDLEIQKDDILYTTVQPCSHRNFDGKGADLFDCTTIILGMGVNNVVYGSRYDEGYEETLSRFVGGGSKLVQVEDQSIQDRCSQIFIDTKKE